MFVVFDKNKKFLGYANDSFEGTGYELLTKEISEEQCGPEWSWQGDMDTGKMVHTKNNY
jgi:hypothetical protein